MSTTTSASFASTAYGEGLLIDLGSPSSYPADFFERERWNYYNASIRGHNIVMLGGRELRIPQRERGSARSDEERSVTGSIISSWQDDAVGSSWVIDATPAYTGARRVRRHVVHLLPDFVAVVDEVRLHDPEEISLRWHTVDRCEPDDQGAFLIRGTRAWLAGRVIRLDAGVITVRRGEHAYAPPYDRDRMGELLEQRQESFVEALLTDRSCRILSIFALGPIDEDPATWTETEAGWRYQGPHGTVEVRAAAESLTVHNTTSSARISLPL